MWSRTWELSRHLQTQEAECGLMCLAAASTVLGQPVSAGEARQWFGASARGMSVAELCEKAGALGLVPTAVRCSADELAAMATPAILHWNERHFCVLLGRRRGGYLVFDPARGERRVDAAEMAAAFAGAAVMLARDLSASPAKSGKPEKSGLLRMLWAYADEARPQIALLLGLSFVLQLAVLALPLLSQVAINFGAMQGNLQAITVVATSMLAMYGLSFVVEAWRGRINHSIATALSGSVSRQLFRHLLHLPVGWFEKRRVADVVSRFESVDPIRAAVSSGLATLVVDGVLGLLVGIALFVISPLLGTVVVLSVLATAVVKTVFASAVAGESALAAGAKVAEYGKRWETFRSIPTLKLACAETAQDRAWSERMDRFLLHTERTQGLTTWQQGTASLVNNLGGVLVIFVGARMVAGEALSIGGLFAFVMYRRYLADKVGAAVDQLSNLWTLRYHHERLAEVFDAQREKRWNDQRDMGGLVTAGAITLQRVGFRHSANDPVLLRDVDATVKAGETVLLTGPSGSGKTTLLRMIAGLATPSSGTILVDGVPLANLSPRQLRGAMAAVLQDDEIFAGSIFENVAMFSETPDLARAVAALEQAELWADVQQLPMGLHTPVGESGRLLSAGQRQRILLARAFYRDPAILLLDEATANLDPDTEARILERIKAMRATKFIVTHQVRLGRLADRTFVIDGRGFREVGRRIDLAEAV